MGYLCIFATLLVAVIHQSLSAEESGNIRIIRYENENSIPGRYKFKYETSDGTYREETGEITDPASDNAVLVVHGSYSFITPDGQRYTVRYVADDQGFRPEVNKSEVAPRAKINPFLRVGGNAISSLQGGGLG